jgi:hypothetical protein
MHPHFSRYDVPMPVALTPLFLVLIILATALYYLALTTSLVFGSCWVAVLLLTRLIDPALRRELSHARAASGATPPVVAAVIISLIMLHAAVAWVYQPCEGARAAGSALILLLVLLSGCLLGAALGAASSRSIDRATNACFFTFCLVALTGISPQTSATSAKALFAFTEPSHFALIFGPFFLFRCIRSRGASRLFILAIGEAIAGTLQNLTLLTICALAAALCLRGLVLIPVIGLLTMALASLELLELTYYTERLDLSGDNTNLSAAVYLQGWQLIGESWERSHGWGVGLRQLGMHGTEVPAADIIFSITKNEGDLRDGVFQLANIVSEFGAIGIGLLLWFLVKAFKAARELRKAARGRQHSFRSSVRALRDRRLLGGYIRARHGIFQQHQPLVGGSAVVFAQ